ncbi:RimJ/RimL family protein N-acetyltransferase [Larkinella arboricola]|uniref:RimJ/RimL family protein N-acetyltransferase n=1 Tax=Larkinella arboricola TaxID=643671 RepID=A0A327WZA5_LARAB|nr:GNAT family protein [Larkinella arboricola]RAJ97484.1 RimJ/RimL family protein N-acetyltransferase [Larkinella arboricola]
MKHRTEINCGDGITLAPPTLADTETIAQLANNRAICLNLRDSLPHPYTLTDAVWFVQTVERGALGLVFGIYLDKTLVGVTGVVPQTDIHRLSGEIGYWLGEPYWGRGIATVAIRHMVQYTFENTDLIRLFAGIMAPNKASMRVLEKNGFTLDLIQRAAVYKAGKVLDEYRYSLINEEKLAALLP